MTELQREIEVLTAAARWVEGLVRSLPERAWEGPGLGDWDMRALVGHTSRALLTVELCVETPAEAEEATSAEAYYERAGVLPATDPGAVLRRGIDAGAALGERPAEEFGAIVERVTGSLREVEDRLVESIVGGILLSSYLPTRTFELTVHGLDIARAADLASEPPAQAIRRTLELAASLAVRSGTGPEVLLALTGRDGLGPGFSVLP